MQGGTCDRGGEVDLGSASHQTTEAPRSEDRSRWQGARGYLGATRRRRDGRPDNSGTAKRRGVPAWGPARSGATWGPTPFSDRQPAPTPRTHPTWARPTRSTDARIDEWDTPTTLDKAQVFIEVARSRSVARLIGATCRNTADRSIPSHLPSAPQQLCRNIFRNLWLKLFTFEYVE